MVKPTTALRIAWQQGYIEYSPGESPRRWETVTRHSQEIIRLQDTVGGRGEYNALYRIRTDDVTRYYLVIEADQGL